MGHVKTILEAETCSAHPNNNYYNHNSTKDSFLHTHIIGVIISNFCYEWLIIVEED